MKVHGCQQMLSLQWLLLLLLSRFSRVRFCATPRQQPTRLLRPWDSPGKNTGVGCHFLLQCTKVKSESEVAQSCPTLCDPMDCRLPGSSIHGVFQARVLEWGATAFSALQWIHVKKLEPICVCVFSKNKHVTFSGKVVNLSVLVLDLSAANPTLPFKVLMSPALNSQSTKTLK